MMIAFKFRGISLFNCLLCVFSILIILLLFLLAYIYNQTNYLATNNQVLTQQSIENAKLLSRTSKDLKDLKNQDQYLINKKLIEENKQIQESFLGASQTYELLTDYRAYGKKTEDLDKLFANSLLLLSQRNYASASAQISSLTKSLEVEKTKYFASLVPTTPPIPSSNNPPDNGYQMQSVQTDSGSFSVGIVSGDLSSTKVVVDTASDSDCKNDCQVLPLSDYVTRNGAYAGVNGTYFCPAEYPSCVGKTNSFDLLVLNKNKKYLNSDNNIYSTNPGVAFLGGSLRFMRQTLEWGRDTGVDGYISNFPLLIIDGQIVFNGDNDAKHNNKGGRSFIAAKDNKVYIGVVFNASVTESAKVLKTLGMNGALNLDDGGSTALWFLGYKAGPGRNIPNAVLLIRK